MNLQESGMYLNNKELLIAVRESKELGKMSHKLARMLQLLCAKYATKGNFINYCVDPETHALTTSGWKNHSDISTSDTILSYNPNSTKLTWSNILDVYVDNYSGPMHHLTSNKIDAFVTPHHKFVISHTKQLTGNTSINPIEQISYSDNIVLMGNSVKSSQATYSDQFVELVGWISSLGDYSSNSITYKPGPTLDRIKESLIKNKIMFFENIATNTIFFNIKATHEIRTAIAPNNTPSMEFMIGLTYLQQVKFLDTLLVTNGDMNQHEIVYCHTNKQHVDAVAILCTLLGRLTSVTQSQFGYELKFGTTKTQAMSEILCDGSYLLPTEQIIPKSQYNGIIWCPKTEYGNFVCKRNDKIYITGNTYNEDMQAYAMLMLARTWNSFDLNKSNNPFAFFTQCVKNSFVQYLNQEKRQRNIRDLLLVDQGLNPSFSFQEDNSDQHYVEDEQDFYFHKETAKALQKQLYTEEENPSDNNIQEQFEDYAIKGIDGEEGEEEEGIDMDENMLLV